jgi:mRNA-degrading endonuclease RelE of RelBE toxin-antitoxin system
LQKRTQEKINQEIKIILDNPEIGEVKKGDLAKIRVHKFKEKNHLFLPAYEVEFGKERIYLYSIGTHEEFYKKLKKYL